MFVLSLVASTIRKSDARDFSSLLESRTPGLPLSAADAFRFALACSLAAPLFLGGGRLTLGGGHTLAFAVVLVKAGALFWTLASLRALLPLRLRVRDLAPLGIVALAASFAQVALSLDHRIEIIVHIATFAAATFAVIHAFWIARTLGRSSVLPLCSARARFSENELVWCPF